MGYARAVATARNGKAILFTGAGFSTGAVSLDGKPFPTGRVLARELCADAGVPTSEDLKQASARYLKTRSSAELIERLQTTFTVKSVEDSHRAIALIPWKTVYTTNYDNVLERAASEGGKKFVPITLDRDPREFRKAKDTVLHINGYIDSLNVSSLSSSFKLTNTSYLTQQFRESVWSEVFIREIQAAQAVFFVGYSLYDIDIQEILFADEALRQKTFFIQPSDIDPEELKYSELNDFGTIMPIGLEKFVADLQNVDPLSISTDNSLILTGFEEVLFDGREPLKVRDTDVFSLLLKGEVSNEMLLDQVSSGTPTNYTFAREIVTRFEENIEGNINFLAIGDLGNGKTILLRTLSAKLLFKGCRVFWLKDESYDCFDELEQILALDTPVVLVFDNYTRKMKLIAHANQKRNNAAIFLLSARTQAHEVSEEELYYANVRLDLKKTVELDVNKLSPDDLDELSRYFETYGLWGTKANLHQDRKIRYLKHDCNSEIHGALLGLLGSPQIQSRFSSLFEEIQNSKQLTRTVIAAFTLNMLGFSQPTLHMIAALSNDRSIFSPLFKANTSTNQLFNNERGIMTPKSSVLAEYALKNFPDISLLVDSLIEICRATRKKAEASELYWDIYRELASFRNIQRMLPEAGKRDSLIRFYEGLRTIDIERKNPHFWLQYAIARLTFPDAPNLEQTKQYLETALSLAKTRKGYTTNDIETQYARYYLEHSINIVSAGSVGYDEFMLAHGMLAKITREERYKREPFRPARLYEPLYKKFEKSFSDERKNGFLVAVETILENIKRLPPKTAEDKTVLATRVSLENVKRAIQGVLKP